MTKQERVIYNRGARAALSIVIKHVRQLNRVSVDGRLNCEALKVWLLDADKRYQAKPGGIGRR